MDRIIWHWTGGTYKANRVDKKHYHFIFEGDGTMVRGNHPIWHNKRITRKRGYAAHTYRSNTGSIGLSMACMAGARENATNGNYPMTEAQFEAMMKETADLCVKYKIPVTRRTCLSHAEVQNTLKIKQRQKWDFNILPFKRNFKGATKCGDYARERVKFYMKTPTAEPLMTAMPPKPKEDSSTVKVSGLIGAGGAVTTGIGALSSIGDRVVALSLVGVGVIIIIAAAYVFRERIKKLADGI